MSDHQPTGAAYEDTGTKHPYHMVNPSIWPLVGAFAAGLLAISAVLMMHKVEWSGLKFGMTEVYIGLAAVIAVMWFWWRDIIKEAVVERVHTAFAKKGLRYGMALFITSEVMFFFAFFWAFFSSALFPVESIGGVWPPPGQKVIDPFDLPFMMTIILLLSGTTCTWAHHAILENKMKEAGKALAYTIALGVLFTGFQAYEYVHAPFNFVDGIYASTFFMATGFHGFHVLIGTIFLIVCYFRTIKGHFTPDSHFGFEAAAWYWHFVDVVWLFLFVSIYWWGGAGGIVAVH
ncbi:MAG: cytochrome c oxidase subunit 3 [Bdellovibrionales bacterium]